MSLAQKCESPGLLSTLPSVWVVRYLFRKTDELIIILSGRWTNDTTTTSCCIILFEDYRNMTSEKKLVSVTSIIS
jgi:hypothetical protein